MATRSRKQMAVGRSLVALLAMLAFGLGTAAA